MNDVWSFNTFTRRWKKAFEDTDGSTFTAFQAEAMTIDVTAKKILIYSNLFWDYSAETWVFDLRERTFTNITSGTEPASRRGARMVYDNESQRAILFGGSDNNDAHTYNETWAYDLKTNTWTNMNPELAPSPRMYHALAWDVASNRIVLFGGVSYPYEPVLDDTWAHDLRQNKWTQLAPRTSPGPSAWHVITGTGRGLLTFGGGPEHSVFTNDDTWLYNSHPDTWKQIRDK